MKVKDSTLLELNLKDLQERLQVEEKNYRDLRFAHVISPIENPSKIRYARRMIARIKTLIRQKKHDNE